MDVASGRLYYYNEKTRQTQWEPPPSLDNESIGAGSGNPNDAGDHYRHHRSSHTAATSSTTERGAGIAVTAASGSSTGIVGQKFEEEKVLAILERAKRAAISRIDGPSGKPGEREMAAATGASTLEDKKRRKRSIDMGALEMRFREAVSQSVNRYLEKWCLSQLGGSSGTVEFMELSRRLTSGIVEKEFRGLRGSNVDGSLISDPHALTEEYGGRELTASKRAKVKSFLIRYLQDHGYRIEEEPNATK
jgi:hypothetical protein